MSARQPPAELPPTTDPRPVQPQRCAVAPDPGQRIEHIIQHLAQLDLRRKPVVSGNECVTGIRERLGILGVGGVVEKEVINIVVSSDQVDRVFEKMYLAGKLDTPGMGIMYITPVDEATT